MNRRIVLSMVAVAIAISWLILPTTTGTRKIYDAYRKNRR